MIFNFRFLTYANKYINYQRSCLARVHINDYTYYYIYCFSVIIIRNEFGMEISCNIYNFNNFIEEI